MSDEQMIEQIAEALANAIAMRKGCPPIRGCLSLMPPHMADNFREDARAAHSVMAARIAELEACLLELLEPLERASAEMVAHGKTPDQNAEAAFDRARAALAPHPERRSEVGQQ